MAGISFTYASGTDVAVTGTAYTANGALELTLGFEPPQGTNLTVVKNIGTTFISGTFDGVPQGGAVSLTYNGKTYTFTANYYGGNGRSLVLQWPYGGLAAWGYNNSGQLGNGTYTSSAVPVEVTTSGTLAGKTVVAVATRGRFSLALTSDGGVFAWGSNDHGQLGNGSNTDSSTPKAVTSSGILAGRTVVAIQANFAYSLALTSDGRVFSWGDNTYGQLGDGTSTPSSVPVAVNPSGELAGKTVVAITGGDYHSLALTSEGRVYAWGCNSEGELGNGTNNTSYAPVAIITSGAMANKTVVAIAAGAKHSLALTSDGYVFAWGYNADGELGNGTTVNSSVPVAVTTSGALNGKLPVAIGNGGGFYSAALTSDGQLIEWGSNYYGQLGNGSTTNSSVPVLVATGAMSGNALATLYQGAFHYFAIMTDGQIFACGYNGYGRLGDGTTTGHTTPVSIPANGAIVGRTVIALAAGTYHSMAILGASSPSVTRDPAGSTINAGASANFSAEPAGFPSPTVHWQVSVSGTAGPFTDITGNSSAMTQNLILSNAPPEWNGYAFRAVFTNLAGEAASTAAVLTVQTLAPAITTSPASQQVLEGNNASFSASATGFPAPVIQWQVSTTGTAGPFTDVASNPTATTGTLALTSVLPEWDGYAYRAIFTNSAGSGTTSAARLTVQTVGPAQYALSLSANPSGGGAVASGPAPEANGKYWAGAAVTVSATPNSGYRFENWTESGVVVSNSSTCVLSMSGKRSLVANFSQQLTPCTVATSVLPDATGIVSGGGSVSYGAAVVLSASAASGYAFRYWTENGNVVGILPRLTFAASGDRTLVANFRSLSGTGTALGPDRILFHSNRAGTWHLYAGAPNSTAAIALTSGSGVSDAFGRWSPDGSRVYFVRNGNRICLLETATGEVVDLTAGTGVAVAPDGKHLLVVKDSLISNSGYDLYSRDLESNAEMLVTSRLGSDEQDPDYSPDGTQVACSSEFWLYNDTPFSNILVASGSGTGVRAITPYNSSSLGTAAQPRWHPDGARIVFSDGSALRTAFSSGSTSQPNYGMPGRTLTSPAFSPDGKQVAFAATASGRTRVSHGYYPSSRLVWFISPDQNESVPTDWWRDASAPFIEVASSNATLGDVDGRGAYASGAVAMVRASPTSGYKFTNWTENGNPVSPLSSYSFNVSGSRSLVANFVPKPLYSLTLLLNPPVGGNAWTETPSDVGANWYEGTAVSVLARPNYGWQFARWSGGASGTGVRTAVTMDGNKTAVASFARRRFWLGVAANPSTLGAAKLSPAPGSDGRLPFETRVTATATPRTGCFFLNWSDNGTVVSYSPAYAFNIWKDQKLVANFSRWPDVAGTYAVTETCSVRIVDASSGVLRQQGTETHAGTLVATQRQNQVWTRSSPGSNLTAVGTGTIYGSRVESYGSAYVASMVPPRATVTSCSVHVTATMSGRNYTYTGTGTIRGTYLATGTYMGVPYQVLTYWVGDITISGRARRQ